MNPFCLFLDKSATLNKWCKSLRLTHDKTGYNMSSSLSAAKVLDAWYIFHLFAMNFLEENLCVFFYSHI